MDEINKNQKLIYKTLESNEFIRGEVNKISYKQNELFVSIIDSKTGFEEPLIFKGDFRNALTFFGTGSEIVYHKIKKTLHQIVGDTLVKIQPQSSYQ